MSMEEQRNEIGRVLSALLLSVKGRCTIRNLENIYKNEAGPSIPYAKFGNISAIDFLRSIPAHVRLVYEGDQHYVYPVVKKETQHIKNLVARQRSSKISNRRKCSRPSRYYPICNAPRPFVPHRVQKSVAHMLTTNPSGVPRSQVAEQLQKSNAIPARVDADNVDEYVSAMPHTAVSSGNKVYPSRSLGARPKSSQRRSDDYDGFDVVSPRDSEKQNTSYNSQTRHHVSPIPGGSETRDYEGAYYSHYDVRARDVTKPAEENKHRISSAEFISRAAESQNTEAARELFPSNDIAEVDAMEAEEATYTSEEEKSVDIIGQKMKERFQKLIEKHPDGIWCVDLMQAYTNEYKFGFDYRDYGFSTVWHFASQLSDIFHLVRLNDRGDFKLYDANKPVPEPPSRPEPPPTFIQWQDDSGVEDINPFALKSDMEAPKLIPDDVIALGETVGQVTIPEIRGPDYTYLEVFVSEVFTPSYFLVHLKSKREKLNDLMESLHDFYEREGDRYFIPTVVLVKGLNCVCKFEDKWHRAIIETVKPNGDVTLIFYDYGTKLTTASNAVRYLTRTYSHLPAQAIPAGLVNIKPKNSTLWTRAASIAFFQKVDNIPLIAVVIKVDRDNNSMLVSLVDTRGETDFHVNDWLTHEGFAEIGTLENCVQFDVRYLDDQAPPPQVLNVVTSRAPNVPLITPQSTLPDSKTLRPPPGFEKPFELTNYAAIMDENLSQRNYSNTANANFFNYSYFNMNNPVPSTTTAYNPWSMSPEQFWTHLLRMDSQLATAVEQFILANRSTNTATNSTLNSTNAESEKPTVKSRETNPFQSYQVREISSTSNSKGSRNFLPNLSTSEFDSCTFLSSTILPQSLETKPNIFNEDSNILDCDQKILREDADRDIDGLSLRLHDSNPFKQHLIGGDSSNLVETNNNTLKAAPLIPPPIPPRNPSSINKNVDLPAKKLLDDNSSTQIYYTGQPVRYNSNDVDKKREEETSKSGDSVSSSQEIANHSLSKKRDSLTPVRGRLSNDAQFLSPRIPPSNYRPPPPLYTGNCMEIQSRNKTSISPRYTSPLISDTSRALIADIRIPFNVLDELESATTEKSDLESRDIKSMNSGSFDKHSGTSNNAKTTKDFDHLGFSTTTKPMHESPISSPHSYPSQPRYYQPIYPHHLPPHQMYRYPMSPRFPNQMPLHRPNMGFYPPPPPPWARPQLYNAAYTRAAAHHSQPPLHPNFWSHSPMFATPQTASVSISANAHNGEHDSDLTLRPNGSSSAKENLRQNGVENYDEEDAGTDLREEKSSSSSEESTNEILDCLTQNFPIRPVNLFKPIDVNKQTIFIFNIEHEGWVCTDEIVQVFLPSETRNIVIRMLSMLNVQINFMEITRAQSPDLFAQLDDSSIRLPRMTNSRKIRGALHLTPINKLCRMMIALRVISDEDIELSKKKQLLPPGSNCAKLVKLMVAYDSDDEYWS